MQNTHRSTRAGRAAELLFVILAAGGLVAAAGFARLPGGSPESLREHEIAASQPEEAPAPTGWGVTIGGVMSSVDYAAFSLRPGESLRHDAPAAGLSVTMETELLIGADDGGRYRFGFDAEGGEGSIKVFSGSKVAAEVSGSGVAGAGSGTSAGKVTPMVALAPGKYSILAVFRRRGDEAARFRIVWEREWQRSLTVGTPQGFLGEPIPPRFTALPPKFRPVAEKQSIEQRGRVLLGELGCVNCHSPGGAAAAVMPRKGPLLGEIARRANPGWMVKWIASPQTVRPGSPMPAVIGDGLNEPNEAVNITHYLMSLAGGPVEPEAPLANEAQGLAKGRELFHTVGCVACHGPQESPREAFADNALPGELSKSEPIKPYGQLGGKWRASGLREFLLDPARTHPDGRMPSMVLTSEESDLLTRYLITRFDAGTPAKLAKFVVDPGRAALGKTAFAARGCADCHSMGGGKEELKSTRPAPALAEVNAAKGCMDPKDLETPRYTLGDADRAAILAALTELKPLSKAKATSSPMTAYAMTVEALNCRACHQHEGIGGLSSAALSYARTIGEQADLGDEGRVPPALTQVGWKLTSSWLREVFENAGRARPYMAMRMPQFGKANVSALPDLMASHAGVWADRDPQEPKPDATAVADGRTLVGEKGMNCISCHTWGDLPPTGSAGPSLTQFGRRLRSDWWRSYVLNPPRFKPGTRMTEFYKPGRSSAETILGGDHLKQPEAMWAFFSLGEIAPAPDGVSGGAGSGPSKPGQGTKLTPTDRPIVFRSFLKDTSSRGIAIGFPQGTHFAYDASSARIVEAWTGDFVDAAGAWKNRGGQIAGGQGKVVWRAVDGPVVMTGQEPKVWPSESEAVYKGFDLDPAGVPTFMSESKAASGGFKLRDRVEPSAVPGVLFTRDLILSAFDSKTIWINAGPGTVSATCESPVTLLKKGDVTWIKVVPLTEQISVHIEVTP